jgi:pimeloyl-ACP methyl ester carboxylesterase
MPVRPVRPQRPAAPAEPAAPARPGRPRRTDTPTRPASDNFVRGTGTTTTTRTTSTTGPFAALAKKGEFQGFVKTKSGQDVFVSVKLGKNPAANRPVVMLDGIAARYERNTGFENLVKQKDQSLISIYLPGQGETLAKDLAGGGKSLQNDLQQEDQAKAVIEVLDALGVKQPVGIAGLSYGGAIAAEAEKLYPDRFNKVMLIAPFVESQGKSSPYYGMMNNPWNPWGGMMYRSATKSALENLFPAPPTVLQPYRGAFHEGLFRLTMGLEDFELDDTVKGMKDVHFLVVPQDSASSPEGNKAAWKGASTGSFTMAPPSEAGHHDLVRANGSLVASWIADVMAGRVKTEAVR